ncbi:hypothetical protein [Sediminibacterium sp.]|uniref:hypothetical protein n=1 Tax=Sediminibacterium sp. TaxID=1917865 RepID=UPI0025F0160C|nr:hypothetical protein [Sediminibacterium sp.]MBW0178813.1 hypothetical protein [Sediminibacterium sp.]
MLATFFYGYNRVTEDVDMWIEDTLENRKRLRASFRELGYGDIESLETMEFVRGWTTFYAAGVELDIMTSMKGLEDASFVECYEMAAFVTLEGVKVPFLHINHLIANKKAVNRPIDQMDVIQLEEIKKLKEKEGKTGN